MLYGAKGFGWKFVEFWMKMKKNKEFMNEGKYGRKKIGYEYGREIIKEIGNKIWSDVIKEIVNIYEGKCQCSLKCECVWTTGKWRIGT